MQTATQIIHACQQLGIGLFSEADKLVVRPASRLTDQLRAAIRQHKADLLAALADEDAREYTDERAAICQADGLPPCGLRPVFEYFLSDNPRQSLIMLGRPEETLAEALESLRDRYGDRLLSVKAYVWPPAPLRLE